MALRFTKKNRLILKETNETSALELALDLAAKIEAIFLVTEASLRHSPLSQALSDGQKLSKALVLKLAIAKEEIREKRG